jgi:hypothetical protein
VNRRKVDGIHNVTATPQYLALAESNLVRLVSIDDGSTVATWRRDQQFLPVTSSDGTRMAVVLKDRAEIYDLEARRLLVSLPLGASKGARSFISLAHDKVAILGEEAVTVRILPEGREIASWSGEGNEITTRGVFHQRTNSLVFGTRSGVVKLSLNGTTKSEVIALVDSPRHLAMLSSTDRMLVATEVRLLLVDLVQNCAVHELIDHAIEPKSLPHKPEPSVKSTPSAFFETAALPISSRLHHARRRRIELAFPKTQRFLIADDLVDGIPDADVKGGDTVRVEFDKLAIGKWILFFGTPENVVGDSFEIAVSLPVTSMTFEKYLPKTRRHRADAGWQPFSGTEVKAMLAENRFRVVLSGIEGFDPRGSEKRRRVAVVAAYAGGGKAGPGYNVLATTAW